MLFDLPCFRKVLAHSRLAMSATDEMWSCEVCTPPVVRAVRRPCKPGRSNCVLQGCISPYRRAEKNVNAWPEQAKRYDRATIDPVHPYHTLFPLLGPPATGTNERALGTSTPHLDSRTWGTSPVHSRTSLLSSSLPPPHIASPSPPHVSFKTGR